MNNEEFILEVKKLVNIEEFNSKQHLLEKVKSDKYQTKIFLDCLKICGSIENSYEAFKILDQISIDSVIAPHDIISELPQIRNVVHLLYGKI